MEKREKKANVQHDTVRMGEYKKKRVQIESAHVMNYIISMRMIIL